jgi:glycerophosphoryl diester phosphodiesterase
MNIRFCLGICLALFGNTASIQAQAPKLPTSKNAFVVIAHRGDHTAAPENTLLAYQNAIAAGVDYVEIDLRTTRDSQLVIMHDAGTDRMTGYKGRVAEMPYDSLRTLQVRDLNHPEWGAYQIPNFKEVLALCKGKINIYLDFKNASVKTTYKEIVKAGMEKNVVVYINSPQQFIEWKSVAPQMPLMISLPQKTSTAAEMYTLLEKYQPAILDGNYTEYTSLTVKAANEKNVPVWADIQSAAEGPAIWEIGIGLGLQGLQTDHPLLLMQFLRTKGILH